MRYRQLGRTGLLVSELGLGTFTFGEKTGAEKYDRVAGLDQEAANGLVRAAFQSGVNLIDTADIYCFGRAEEIVGQALQDLGIARKDVVIATKCYNPVGAGPNDRGASRGHIMDSVEASLRRLKTGHIDLYQIHAHDPITPLDETLRTLDDLVSQGLVRYVGCSNWPAWRVSKALGICERRGFARLDSTQVYYSLAGRDIEREIAPMAAEEGVGILVWSPLAGGALSGKFEPGSSTGEKPEGRRSGGYNFPPVDGGRASRCIAVMRDIAARHDCGVATVALAFILSRPFITSVLIGAKRLDQLQQNLAAANLELDAEDLCRLDDVSRLPAEYPGWIVDRQGARRWPGVDGSV
ncbi:MAG: aldo/keto reductase [Rhizobiaceae bacterium]